MSTTINPAPDQQDSSALRCIDWHCLRVGTRLRVPLYDERNVLLLAAGKVIEPAFLLKLEARGVSEVKLPESELARMLAGKPQGTETSVPTARAGVICPESNDETSLLDKAIESGASLGLPEQGEPFASEVTRHGAKVFDQDLEEHFIENHSESVQQLDFIYDSIAKGDSIDTEGLSSVADEAMNQLRADPDLFTCLGINPGAGTYPARHCVHTQMLSISIGMQLGLDHETLKELSIGCLLHDSGMLKIDKEIYMQPGPLTTNQFLEITKHPVRVFEAMREMEAIPRRSTFIAYQIHERCNGSGYPRKRSGNQIHFLAKVAAVADSFIALMAPRPHRGGILPYKAMESMIQGVKRGLFAPEAVKALLHTTSLFPLGSYVKLNDGRVGRVIRSNGEHYGSPVVEAWQPDLTHLEPEVVNLTETGDVAISGAIPELPQADMSEGIEDNWE